MKIVTTQSELASEIDALKGQGLSVGLVPTMGALHNGHLSLIAQSKKSTAITVTSIFVNPTQFDNKEDLLKYPKPIKEDVKKLTEVACDILFLPEVGEMYQEGEKWDYEVGVLDSILEGEFRPGHYKGVTQIVYKLFSLVKPDIAFFGQKDYQQFLVVKKMANDFNLPVQLVACDIIREDDGLAMSSRNIRLNGEEREASIALFKALSYIKQNYKEMSIVDLLEEAKQYFNNGFLKLEYL
ncbi:pantoate--beta-alanine ligase, partial [Pseudoxanthomonas sp. SGD-10]